MYKFNDLEKNKKYFDSYNYYVSTIESLLNIVGILIFV